MEAGASGGKEGLRVAFRPEGTGGQGLLKNGYLHMEYFFYAGHQPGHWAESVSLAFYNPVRFRMNLSPVRILSLKTLQDSNSHGTRPILTKATRVSGYQPKRYKHVAMA